MSTKVAQKIIKKTSNLKRSEGTSEWVKIDTKLSEVRDKFEDYFRSSMSYCGVYYIKDYNPDNITTGVMSPLASNSILGKETKN